MPLITRYLALVVAWSALFVAISAIAPDVSLLFDPRTVAFVTLFPWLVACIGFPFRDLGASLADAVRPGIRDLPVERRVQSARVLRAVGGLTLATGVIAFFGTYLNLLSGLALKTGTATKTDYITGFSAMLLAPLYGLALRAFLYDPIATSIESASALAMERDAADAD